MSIELIIFLVVWLISTEVAFFGFFRDEYIDFIPGKLISIFAGILAAMILFLIPCSMSYGVPIGNNPNLMAYVWYYGIILSIAAFFSINYAIHKWLKGKGK